MDTIKLLFIACLLLLSACAPKPPTTDAFMDSSKPLNALKPTDEVNGKIAPTAVTSWELNGMIAGKNSNKGWSATINWLQQGPHQYQIRLLGPLGGGTILIQKRAGIVTFSDGPKRDSSRNADQLLLKHTGIRLPVQNLYYWTRGLKAPGAIQSANYDSNHHLTSLIQSGYAIHFTDYTSINHVDLPRKIQLQGQDTSIKLVVSQWRI